MTIDEAIKRAEEAAECEQKIVDTHYISDDVSIDEIFCDDTEVIEEHLAVYKKGAEEDRQLTEWLKELKRLKEQQPCENCVNRAEVFNILSRNYCGYSVAADGNCVPGNYREGIYDEIKALPPVTPKGVTITDFADKCRECGKQKKGEWIKHDTGHSVYYDCSLCGCAAPCTETADKILWKLANYCPDCGAKMWEIPTGSENKVGWSSLENVRNKVEKE